MHNLVFPKVIVTQWRLEPPAVDHEYEASNVTRILAQEFLPEKPAFRFLRQVCQLPHDEQELSLFSIRFGHRLR
jgi:hypothetical protein